MLSAYTIMLLFANTFGLGDELERANDGLIVVPPGSLNSGPDNTDSQNSASDNTDSQSSGSSAGNVRNNSNPR
jgi:hypothetical protein